LYGFCRGQEIAEVAERSRKIVASRFHFDELTGLSVDDDAKIELPLSLSRRK
jgi:hypothetical protein